MTLQPSQRLPTERGELDLFVSRMLADTGVFARSVLGMDTDEDATGMSTVKRGSGGVRAWGRHQEMVRFLDDWNIKLGILLASRGSYKSSIVEALICRAILAFPDISILLMMHTSKEAENRVRVIRDILTNNPIIRELYGDLEGPIWRQDEFVTSLRRNQSRLEPTLCASGPDNIRTGVHPDLLLFDDVVHKDNARTKESIEATIEAVRFTMGLATENTVVRDIGTPYAEGDAHHFLLEQPQWKRLILPVDSEIHQLDDGRLVLEGASGWPHYTKEYLERHLAMGVQYFMSQFKLKISAGATQAFHRHQFRGQSWNPKWRELTGYLLTDVAPGQKEEDCLNVLAYCGLSQDLKLHLLDLEIGHWSVTEFCERFLAMRAEWSGKVQHQAELMEAGAIAHGYEAMLSLKSKEQNVRLNLVRLPRDQRELGKEQRIYCLQPRLWTDGLIVSTDTVPKHWIDGARVKTLWDPEGWTDPETGRKMPDGELVNQFIKFPSTKVRRDIPDAIANIDAIDKQTGHRVCFWRRPTGQEPDQAVLRRPVSQVGSGTVSSFYSRAAQRLRGR